VVQGTSAAFRHRVDSSPVLSWCAAYKEKGSRCSTIVCKDAFIPTVVYPDDLELAHLTAGSHCNAPSSLPHRTKSRRHVVGGIYKRQSCQSPAFTDFPRN
jgi:hypothetical protein